MVLTFVLLSLVAKFLSCRTGPLRVGPSLRDLYTGLGRMRCVGPPFGRELTSRLAEADDLVGDVWLFERGDLFGGELDGEGGYCVGEVIRFRGADNR
jgi:hypothetical protein